MFFDRNTALWIEPNLQRLKALRLKVRSRLACFFVSLRLGCDGLTRKPFLRAERTERIAFFSEPGLQTTRVEPRGLRLSAVNRLRAFGTLPPAAGLTEVSGAGLGQ